MRRYYSVKEAAKRLEVTERTIWNYIQHGDVSMHRKKYGRSGRKGTWIDGLSLKKCILRKKHPIIYGCRNNMVEYFRYEEKRKLRIKIALREVGLMKMENSLDRLSYFQEANVEIDSLIEKYIEYWDKYDVAAYMEVSLRTVKRYIKCGKLKVAKVDKERRQLFSNLAVMELYCELHGGHTSGNDDVDNSSFYELCTYLEDHPECVTHLREYLNGL